MIANDDRISQLEMRVARLEGIMEQMSKRLDDIYKLLIVVIVLGGTGLITLVVNTVVQLTKQ